VAFREIREYATGSLHDGAKTKRATNNKKANVKTGFGKFVRIGEEIGASGNPCGSSRNPSPVKPDGATSSLEGLGDMKSQSVLVRKWNSIVLGNTED
jgi:hypothetical protein